LRRPALALAAGISGALLLFAALHLPPAFREAVLGLAALSLTYPFFKRFPLTKTLAVTVAWAWGAAVLPFAGRAAPGPLWTRSWESGILPPLALLVAANTILCDLKDRERDRDADIRTLPVIYGPGVTCRIATALLILSLVLAAIQGSLALALPAAGLAVAAQFPTLLGRQVAGPLIADSLLLLPGLLTLAGA